MLTLQSSLQPFVQVHLYRELLGRFDPCATAPSASTHLPVVQGLQSLHFVWVSATYVSPVWQECTPSTTFSKNDQLKPASVSTSFLPRRLPSQKNQAAKHGQLSAVAGGWASRVRNHSDHQKPQRGAWSSRSTPPRWELLLAPLPPPSFLSGWPSWPFGCYVSASPKHHWHVKP